MGKMYIPPKAVNNNNNNNFPFTLDNVSLLFPTFMCLSPCASCAFLIIWNSLNVINVKKNKASNIKMLKLALKKIIMHRFI